MTIQKGIIEIDGFNLRYQIEGAGIPILCIGSTLFYSRIFSAQIKNQLQFIFIDHCGFTKAPAREISNKEYSLENLIRHIEIIRTKLKLHRFFILGHSGHAFMALEYAKKHPKNILGNILVGVSPDYSAQSHQSTDIFFEESASDDRKQFYLRKMNELPELIKLSPEKRFVHFCLCSGARNWFRHDFDAVFLWKGVETNMQMIDHVWGTIFKDIDITHQLDSYKIPTLLMIGKYDFVTGPTNLWDEVKNKFCDLKIKIFEKSGHYPMFEENDLFDTELLNWIEEKYRKS
ncbi:alpha/beta hydrolase [Maribellus sp. YY47]|uniref:alpha/beta fold hydrolase n=1 Tax=Maribellus sp. YY47 TaxID=2929486 RepID=UPI0020019ECA|nr:alpha/beta hydrolase [Maribellus sp. YY47]MCK3685900.1 alpha/beta hydrolase [Maribellus sp. YY47]